MNPLATRARRIRPATLAWLALLVLTGLSVLAAGLGHQGPARVWMSLAVAALCAVKGDLLIRHYLKAREAGPVFHAIVRAFALVAPLALAVSALREAAGG